MSLSEQERQAIVEMQNRIRERRKKSDEKYTPPEGVNAQLFSKVYRTPDEKGNLPPEPTAGDSSLAFRKSGEPSIEPSLQKSERIKAEKKEKKLFDAKQAFKTATSERAVKRLNNTLFNSQMQTFKEGIKNVSDQISALDYSINNDDLNDAQKNLKTKQRDALLEDLDVQRQVYEGFLADALGGVARPANTTETPATPEIDLSNSNITLGGEKITGMQDIVDFVAQNPNIDIESFINALSSEIPEDALRTALQK
jgi:hypothetical protein